MKQILFIAFLALGPALADQTRVVPEIYSDAAATNAGYAVARDSRGPLVPVDASWSAERIALLCQHRS